MNFNIFPYVEEIDRNKLHSVPSSIYSVSTSYHAKILINRIKKKFGESHIIDLTSNIGGNTIPFGLNFKKVDAVEIDKKTYNALNHNLRVYKLKNVKTHNMDGNEFIDKNKKKHNIWFIDPPWGGSDYKKEKKMELFLSDISLPNIVKTIIIKHSPIAFYLKVPLNYDTENLIKKIEKKSKEINILTMKSTKGKLQYIIIEIIM